MNPPAAGVRDGRASGRRRRLAAVAVWIAVLAACALVVARARISADLSAFLPRAPTAQQRVLVDQLREGAVSRLILMAVQGADAPGRAALSRALAQRLRADPQFLLVANGEARGVDAERELLLRHRYALSPQVTPQRFTVEGLRSAIGDTLDLLASPAGLLVKGTVPRDPTGEFVALVMGEAGAGATTSVADGVWASRDGGRSLLLAHTRAAGSDTDGQERAVAAIREAFAAVVAAGGQAAAAPPSPRDANSAAATAGHAAAAPEGAAPASHAVAELLLSGPGVFSVEARNTIKAEAARLASLGLLGVATLLLLVFRSPGALLLALLPVASGALVAVAAVSLGHGVVHGVTLGFGTTLIGEAVDYSIYLFVQSRAGAHPPGGQRSVGAHPGAGPPQAGGRPLGGQRSVGAHPAGAVADAPGDEDWLATFWPTIRLGVATSVAGFGALLFSGFPGLAQLGLYSIAGLLTAALVTRFVLPALLPARFAIRDLSPLGARLAAWAGRAQRLRWLLALLVVVAASFLVMRHERLWASELSALSPVPAWQQQLDTALRADLGAPDTRYLVLASGPDEEAALQAAERAAARLQPLVEQGAIAGFETPARYLPSAATQRARLASLPDADELRGRLRQALAGLPLRAERLEPFVADAAAARVAAPLTRDDLRGTSLALAVDALLVRGSEGWSALLPLRSPRGASPPGAGPPQAGGSPLGGQRSVGAHPPGAGPSQAGGSPLGGQRSVGVPPPHGIDADRVRAAVAGSDAVFVDLKQESDDLYAGYLREAIALAVAGAVAILLLLAVALRSAARVARVAAPLAAAVVVVMGAQAALGVQLTLLHLVGMLLIAAVGSNYALFFDRGCAATADGPAPRMLASLLLASLTTMLGFGLLAFSSVPVLQAIGATVGPGALLALLFSAALSGRAAGGPA